jgi:hypothetical protein
MDGYTAFLLIVCCLLLLLFLGVIWTQRGQTIAVEAEVSPRDVASAAVHHFSRHGWATTSNSSGTVTFTKAATPSCAVASFLALFGLVLGLLYWLVGRRNRVISVTAELLRRWPVHSQVVVSWSGRREAGFLCKEFCDALEAETYLGEENDDNELLPEANVGHVPAAPDQRLASPRRAPRQRRRYARRQLQVVASEPEGVTVLPTCARCGSNDLSERERSRNPTICNACLAAVLDN